MSDYSLPQFLDARRRLRQAAGMAEERFAEGKVRGMLDDEIKALTQAGKSPEEIAALIAPSGIVLPATTVAEAPADGWGERS